MTAICKSQTSSERVTKQQLRDSCFLVLSGFTLKGLIHTSITNSFTKMYCQPQPAHRLFFFLPLPLSPVNDNLRLLPYIWRWPHADTLSSDESRGNALRLTAPLSWGNLDSRSAAGKTLAEAADRPSQIVFPAHSASAEWNLLGIGCVN